MHSEARPRMQILTSLLLSMALLSGCASAGQQPPPASKSDPKPSSKPISKPTAAVMPAEQTVTLNLGAQASLADGSRLTYVRLVNDSRCPPKVQCIWAGDAEIELSLVAAGSSKARTFSLHTSPLQDRGHSELDAGNLHITLQALERGVAPKATRLVSPAQGISGK